MDLLNRKHSRARLAGLIAAAALIVVSVPARADQAGIKAVFDVTMSGVSIGKGNLSANVNPSGYSIGVSAKVSGIARLVSGGQGSAQSQGYYNGGALFPINYSIKNTVDNLKNAVSLKMKDNRIVSESVIPPTPYSRERVPITAEARRGVIDPLSAFLVPSSSKDTLDPANCDRTLKIYDGRQRYNIAMAYARTEPSRAVGDLQGTSLVCKAVWRPIAGHKADNPETAQMEENRDVETALTPIPGTRFLIISRISIGTGVGNLVINASRVSLMPGQQASLQ